jgi:hypothetical protein
MKTPKLTMSAVRAAEARATEYQLVDALGLRLRVMPSGTKAWAVRTYSPGGMHQRNLGTWPAMSLADARAAAATARAEATQSSSRHADLHTGAEEALAALLSVFNALRDQLGRPVELSDLLRLLRSKPKG